MDEKREHLNSHYGNPLKGIGDQKQVSRTIQLVKQNKDPFYIKKAFFKAQEEIWKLTHFTMQKKKYNLQKIL